jgi:hypothetical protein
MILTRENQGTQTSTFRTVTCSTTNPKCTGLGFLKFYNFAFEHVENFNYLGSIFNADNKMNIEIA